MERIPASERTREKLKALIEGRSEAEERGSELVRLAARLILEAMRWGAITTPAARPPALAIAMGIARRV